MKSWDVAGCKPPCYRCTSLWRTLSDCHCSVPGWLACERHCASEVLTEQQQHEISLLTFTDLTALGRTQTTATHNWTRLLLTENDSTSLPRDSYVMKWKEMFPSVGYSQTLTLSWESPKNKHWCFAWITTINIMINIHIYTLHDQHKVKFVLTDAL